MLTPKQSEFVKRYVINAGPTMDTDFDSVKAKDRGKKAKTIHDRIEKGQVYWQNRLGELKGKEPRDLLVNTAWIDRDAKAFRKMYEEAKVFMTPEQKATCEGCIRRMIQQAEDARLGMRYDVNLSAKNAVEGDWPRLARSAQSAESRKEMLLKIEQIEHEMDAMSLSLELAGEKTAVVDKFAPVVKKLREKYDAKVPAFDGKVEEVPFVEGGEPGLTYSPSICLQIYDLCGRNWFELKKQYKTAGFVEKVKAKLGRPPTDGEEVMWQLWAYRKAVVDDLIGKATAKFKVAGKGKGWVAVGSTNLESDYDLSVMQHGEGEGAGDDWEVVDWFNKEFQKKYGTQPGIMFDTNLYASAPARKKLSDNPQTPSEVAMAAMERSGQDVGALMKQRRFMSWEEYEDMMNTVLDEMERTNTDAEIVMATRTQFEEADARYQQAQVKTLERSETILADMINDLQQQQDQAADPQRAKKLAELKKLQSEQARLKSAAESAKGAEQSKLILERAEMLEGAEDVILAVTNAIYVDAVKQSRDVEQLAVALAKKIEELEKELQNLNKADPKDEELIRTRTAELETAKKDFDGRATLSKELFTDAVFFANEAYHADGPFKHVVQATQAVESDMEREYNEKNGEKAWKKLSKEEKAKIVDPEMTRRRNELTLHECLQSFNEQLGDFIKDLHHHANDKSEDLPGTGFFRSSKYLDRLIDAVALLEQKAEGGLGVKIPGKLPTLQAYRDALGKGLLALRKGKIKIEKDDVGEAEKQEQMEAFAINEIKTLFGVSTLHDLGKLFKTFGSQVNAKLRAQVALEMKTLEGQAFFKPV